MQIVDDFDFENENDAKKAQKEIDGVKYVISKSNMEDPEVVLKIYTGLIEKNYFKTVVGLKFLIELKSRLEELGVEKEKIPAIPIVSGMPMQIIEQQENNAESSDGKYSSKNMQDMADELKDTKDTLKKTAVAFKKLNSKKNLATFFATVFAIVIIGMFAIIILTGSTTTIVNYEDKVINKYESWNKQLEKKEKQLEKREKALKDKEEKLSKEDSTEKNSTEKSSTEKNSTEKNSTEKSIETEKNEES
ncbi:hypothetical protein SAMN04487761_10132 [Lachnospiraceae bacterium C7]|nr:hypothetical protein SAMN04487761_10132 [Lachnospiraceae bacterium C7]